MNKITWHGVLQVLMIAGQVLTAVAPQVPAKYKPLVMSAIGVIQFLLHQYALNQPQPGPTSEPPPPVQ